MFAEAETGVENRRTRPPFPSFRRSHRPTAIVTPPQRKVSRIPAHTRSSASVVEWSARKPH